MGFQFPFIENPYNKLLIGKKCATDDRIGNWIRAAPRYPMESKQFDAIRRAEVVALSVHLVCRDATFVMQSAATWRCMRHLLRHHEHGARAKLEVAPRINYELPAECFYKRDSRIPPTKLRMHYVWFRLRPIVNLPFDCACMGAVCSPLQKTRILQDIRARRALQFIRDCATHFLSPSILR